TLNGAGDGIIVEPTSIRIRSGGLDRPRPVRWTGMYWKDATIAKEPRSGMAAGGWRTIARTSVRKIAADRSDVLQRERRRMFAVDVAYAVLLSERGTDRALSTAFHEPRIAGQRGDDSSDKSRALAIGEIEPA